METMASSTQVDFLPQLKAIGQRLKKRFFRKPNISEAIEQFENLCKQLKRDGQDEFAGICLLEAAKCQESVQTNSIEYANTLVRAAKFFLDAAKSQSIFESDPNAYNAINAGNFQLAMQNLGKASNVYKEHQHHALSLLIMTLMGEKYYEVKEYGESLKCFRSALDLANFFYPISDQLVLAERLLKCKIKMTDLASAIATVTDYLKKMRKLESELPKEFFKMYSIRFEIIHVCLVLLHEPASADYMKILWPETLGLLAESQDDIEESRIYLKSLVLAAQQGSSTDIIQIRDHLSPKLSDVEFELFATLVESTW